MLESTLAQLDPYDSWDNLHGPSRPEHHWSTDNVGEAVPGVMSPLGASFWGYHAEGTTRGSFAAIGAFSRAEREIPEPLEDRVVRIFCGRVALQIELMTTFGDRLPGTSGQEMAAALLGTVPDDIEYRPTRRRYPFIACKLPATFLSLPRRLRTEPPRVHRWWQASVAALPSLNLEGARDLMADALDQWADALLLQTISVIGSAQLMHEALSKLIERAGVGDMGTLSGAGGAEMAVIEDIWRASRGEISIDEVVREHGFHGPLEGEVSSVVWREDPAPLERLIREYAAREDPQDPRAHVARAKARLPEAQREVLAALPRWQRPAARQFLRLAARRIPLRGVAKRSFLQGIDIIRGSARRMGAELAEAGLLAEPEDVFYLTFEELQRAELPRGVEDLVARRRERREVYKRLALPGAWRGQPQPVPIDGRSAEEAGRAEHVDGVGVSSGVVEGVARVVTDPAFSEVEPDEILVAPTTDPSWSSIMFISAGLVVDIGGPLSHAAVVARELGLPCVVNTRTGTRDICTGDRVRVDGDAGTVEILERRDDQ